MNITTEQFNTSFSKLPYVIREYLAYAELSKVAQSIGDKYKLHIDTIGGLEREATNMLLGLENPEQFSGELKSLGIPTEQVSSILQELNQLVFIPLRERVQKEGNYDPAKEEEKLQERFVADGLEASPATKIPVPSKPISPAAPLTVPARTTSPAPIVSTPTYAQVPTTPVLSISELSRPISPTPPTSRPTPPIPDNLPGTGLVVPASSEGMPVPPAQTVMHTMKGDMDAVKSGTFGQQPAAPADFTQKMPATPMPQPQPSAPAPTAAYVPAPRPPAPAPQSFPKPVSAAIATPAASIAPAKPTVTAATSQSAATQPSKNEAFHEVLKQYGIDPYREPVE